MECFHEITESVMGAVWTEIINASSSLNDEILLMQTAVFPLITYNIDLWNVLPIDHLTQYPVMKGSAHNYSLYFCA